MSSIDVSNGGMFEITNPNYDDKELRRMLEEHKNTIIRAASPFIEGIRIFNKTKNVVVRITFFNKQVLVSVTNPADEVFHLDNEPEPQTTPFDVNGDLKQNATATDPGTTPTR
jgi:hypothetical protein